MTLVGRSKIDHPALGTAGGSALHASIETIYTNVGDHLSGRYLTATGIANSAVTTFNHNFGVPFADLQVLIYTGTYPALTRVADPAGSGWAIAATSGFLQEKVDVTAPSSGGPHSFSVLISEKVSASATQGGIVNTTTQTFAGVKTWNDIQTFKAAAGSITVFTYDSAGAATLGASGSAQPLTMNALNLNILRADGSRLRLTATGSNSFFDSFGLDNSTNGTFSLRSGRADFSNIITILSTTSLGSFSIGPQGVLTLPSTTKAASRPVLDLTQREGNSLWFGHPNSNYNGILGGLSSNGPAFIGAYFYHSNVADELRRSGTNGPSMIKFKSTGGMDFFADAAGTLDAVWGQTNVGGFNEVGAFTFGSAATSLGAITHTFQNGTNVNTDGTITLLVTTGNQGAHAAVFKLTNSLHAAADTFQITVGSGITSFRNGTPTTLASVDNTTGAWTFGSPTGAGSNINTHYAGYHRFRIDSSSKYIDLTNDSSNNYIDASHTLYIRTNGASSATNAAIASTTGIWTLGTSSTPTHSAVTDKGTFSLGGSSVNSSNNVIRNNSVSGQGSYYDVAENGTVRWAWGSDAGAGSWYLKQGGAGGTAMMSCDSAGGIILGPTSNGQIVDFRVPTQLTVGVSGGGAALPANPNGYFTIKIQGGSYVVPFYTV